MDFNVVNSLYFQTSWVSTDVWWKFHVNSLIGNIFTETNVDASNTYYPHCINNAMKRSVDHVLLWFLNISHCWCILNTIYIVWICSIDWWWQQQHRTGISSSTMDVSPLVEISSCQANKTFLFHGYFSQTTSTHQDYYSAMNGDCCTFLQVMFTFTLHQSAPLLQLQSNQTHHAHEHITLMNTSCSWTHHAHERSMGRNKPTVEKSEDNRGVEMKKMSRVIRESLLYLFDFLTQSLRWMVTNSIAEWPTS